MYALLNKGIKLAALLGPSSWIRQPSRFSEVYSSSKETRMTMEMLHHCGDARPLMSKVDRNFVTYFH